MGEVTAEVAGEQPRLDMRDKSKRNLLPEKAMQDRLLLALLIGCQDRSSSFISKPHCPPWRYVETGSAKLPPINECDSEAVGDQWPKLFHEIEGESWAARAQCMQIADLGIESYPLKGTNTFLSEQCVEKRQQGIRAITWRSTRTALKGKDVPLSTNQ